MGHFWSGIVLGFALGVVGNVIVNHYWELRSRREAFRQAKRLVGTWDAYNIRGQELEVMKGAGKTIVNAKPYFWSANSSVLDVTGEDTSDGRKHRGPLMLDPLSPRLAPRVLIYDSPTPDKVMEQRIVISADFQTLYVFPELATIGLQSYTPSHALKKAKV